MQVPPQLVVKREQHTPAEHDCSRRSQTVPQRPQLDRSLLRSTQAPLQLVCRDGQACTQLPALHATLPPVGAAQALPQRPQFDALVLRFTHAPPQLVRPAVQVTTQVPAAQTCPLAQTLPQRPQWARSLLRSTQVEEHAVCPDGHAHTPFTHAAPPVHRSPQRPQCRLFELRSVHTPPQFVVGAAHTVTHAPD